MDCRKALGLLALLGGLSGCTPTSLFPLLSSNEPPTPTSPLTEPISREKVKELKPATWVAIGDYREQMAAVATASPEDRANLADSARQAYEHALAKDPHYLAAHVALARHWDQYDEHDRALACYNEALKLEPNNSVLWYESGMCHAKHKDWNGALERLHKAVTLDGSNRQLTAGYALCLARAERFDESLAWLKKVYSEPEAYFTLGRMLHHMSRDDLSRQQLVQALHLDPNLKAAQDLLDELDPDGAHVEAPATAEAAPPGRE